MPARDFFNGALGAHRVASTQLIRGNGESDGLPRGGATGWPRCGATAFRRGGGPQKGLKTNSRLATARGTLTWCSFLDIRIGYSSILSLTTWLISPQRSQRRHRMNTARP